MVRPNGTDSEISIYEGVHCTKPETSADILLLFLLPCIFASLFLGAKREGNFLEGAGSCDMPEDLKVVPLIECGVCRQGDFRLR